jgi:hypothetical protein
VVLGKTVEAGLAEDEVHDIMARHREMVVRLQLRAVL